MGVLVGVATGEIAPVLGMDSIQKIRRGPGDHLAFFPATRGDEAREDITQTTLSGGYEAALYLDADMEFPPDTLERLWATGKDVVSGLYYRRQIPAAPIAFRAGDAWPLEPLFDTPDTGLIEIGATGFGCLLVRRRVLLGMRELLRPGEPYISNRDLVEATGDYGTVGADLRFCYRCKKIGYPVHLLCDLLCGHMVYFPLGREFFNWQGRGEPYAHIWDRFARERLEVYLNKGGEVDEGYIQSKLKWHDGEIKNIYGKATKLRQELVRLQGLATQHEGAKKAFLQMLEDLKKKPEEPKVELPIG